MDDRDHTPLIRKIVVLFPVAILVMVVISVVLAARFAGAEKEPKLKFVVTPEETPAHAIAGGRGSARLLLGPHSGAGEAALSYLILVPGTEIPAHVHESSAELLYIEAGWVDMVIKGKSFRAEKGDAVYIPAGVEHSAKAGGHLTPVKAVQVYVGPGPEERFRQGKIVPGD